MSETRADANQTILFVRDLDDRKGESLNMIKLGIRSLLPALLLGASSAFAADAVTKKAATYILGSKDDSRPAGTIIEEERIMTLQNGKMELNFQGQIMDGSMTIAETESDKWEFLEGGKRRYTLLKAGGDQKMVMMGQAQPMPKAENPILGKALIFNKKDGKWCGALEKGDATEAEQAKIDEQVKELEKNTSFEVYGDTPRAVGDEWEVDGTDAFGLGGDELLEGKMKVKLEKVEMHQGVKCAVLKCSIDIKGNVEEMFGMSLGIKGQAIIYRSIADQIDIAGDVTGVMQMLGKMEPQPGIALDMTMNGPMTMKTTAKVSKK